MRRPQSGIACVLAGSMFCMLVGHLAIAIRHRKDGAFALREPVSEREFSPAGQGPLARNMAISNRSEGLDILVLEELDYIYLFHYASPDVVRHLYFGAPRQEFFIRAYDRLAHWARLDMKTTTFDAFLSAHDHFEVYATKPYTSACGHCVEAFLDAGYTIESAHSDLSGTLYEYRKRSSGGGIDMDRPSHPTLPLTPLQSGKLARPQGALAKSLR